MNLITNTLQALVRRRLWPVALLLIAALVAVPMTLAKSPEPAAPPTAVAAAKAQENEELAKPVVQLRETPAGTQRRRRVLGQAKDPFAPAPLPKVKKKKAHAAKKASATPTPTATATPSTSAGGGSTAPAATATPVPMTTVPKGSVRVRFGLTSADTPTESIIGHLGALPSADSPVLALEGLKDNGKTAVFTVPGSVTAVGDGKCRPTTKDCETLELRAGQTEFVTVKGEPTTDTTTTADATTTATTTTPTDQEYELDVVKIFDDAARIPTSKLPVGSTSGQ